jgi:hypothetical protein
MMDNEGGSFLTRKFAGIPAWVIMAGVAALAYFLFMRNSSSSTPTNSTSGGGGQVHTGKTVVQSGAVKINVSGGDGGDEKQPKPPPHKGGGKTKSFVVPRDETLGQFATSRHWSLNTINAMASFKQPKGSSYAGQELRPDTPLTKGSTIFRQIR